MERFASQTSSEVGLISKSQFSQLIRISTDRSISISLSMSNKLFSCVEKAASKCLYVNVYELN